MGRESRVQCSKSRGVGLVLWTLDFGLYYSHFSS
jgi:hypothetical protein